MWVSAISEDGYISLLLRTSFSSAVSAWSCGLYCSDSYYKGDGPEGVAVMWFSRSDFRANMLAGWVWEALREGSNYFIFVFIIRRLEN